MGGAACPAARALLPSGCSSLQPPCRSSPGGCLSPAGPASLAAAPASAASPEVVASLGLATACSCPAPFAEEGSRSALKPLFVGENGLASAGNVRRPSSSSLHAGSAPCAAARAERAWSSSPKMLRSQPPPLYDSGPLSLSLFPSMRTMSAWSCTAAPPSPDAPCLSPASVESPALSGERAGIGDTFCSSLRSPLWEATSSWPARPGGKAARAPAPPTARLAASPSRGEASRSSGRGSGASSPKAAPS